MRAHTRKHHIDDNHNFDRSKSKIQENDDQPIDWREAFSDLINEFTEVGASIRGFRLREGWTQIELGKKVGVSQANLSKIEHGKRSIGKKLAKKLVDIFKVDYRIFL